MSTMLNRSKHCQSRCPDESCEDLCSYDDDVEDEELDKVVVIQLSANNSLS